VSSAQGHHGTRQHRCPCSAPQSSSATREGGGKVKGALLTWNPMPPPPFSMTEEPTLEVMMRSVFLKSTVRPLQSVSRPSSRIWNPHAAPRHTAGERREVRQEARGPEVGGEQRFHSDARCFDGEAGAGKRVS